jgi:lipid-binding SYLF domain-containing protein
MRKFLSCLACSLFVVAPFLAEVASASDQSKDDARLRTLRSEILRYSRARGLFAGVSLDGSTIRPDNGDNQHLYGRKIPASDIVLSHRVAVPPAANQMISTLDAKTPKHRQ